VALLDYFGSIDKLRAASIEELAAAPGIGPKFSVELHRFFSSKKITSVTADQTNFS
jgi:ERCC4-type nuclease